jgi:PAS domain-containing protein
LASLSGELVYVNEEAERLFGIAHGTFPHGRYLADVISDTNHLSSLEGVARDGRQRQFQMSHQFGEGGHIHFYCRVARVSAPSGIPAWLVFIAFAPNRETPAIDASIAAPESAQMLDQLSGIALWKIRKNDNDDWADCPMRWSESPFEIPALDSVLRRATLRAYTELIVPEDRPPMFASLARSITDGSPYQAVYWLISDSAAPIIIASRAIVIPDPVTGTPSELWGLEQDITMIFNGQAVPHNKASTLDAIGSTIDGPVYAVDRAFRYIYFNDFFRDAARRVFGVEVELGMKIVEQDTRRAAVLANLRRAVGGVRVVEETTIPSDGAADCQYELTYAPLSSPTRSAGVAVFGVRVARSRGRQS